MKDVATAALHVGAQQPHALLVNHLEIGDEPSGEIPHRTGRRLDAMMAREIGSDLIVLAELQEPRQTHTGDNVVGILGPRGNDARQLR